MEKTADKLRAMRIDHLLDWPDGLLLNAEQAEALIAWVEAVERIKVGRKARPLRSTNALLAALSQLAEERDAMASVVKNCIGVIIPAPFPETDMPCPRCGASDLGEVIPAEANQDEQFGPQGTRWRKHIRINHWRRDRVVEIKCAACGMKWPV